MSLKPQQRIDISHLFSNELTLFLNNASRSPLPTTHQAILHRFMTDWHRGAHEPYYYNFQHADALKNELGHFISCNPDHIAIGTNVAQSFASILHGYPWQPGDEIMLLTDDYPSVTLPFHDHPMINLRWIDPINGLASIDELQNHLTPKTKALALSWVNYTTGQVNPIAEISTFCKKYNIQLLVDATQALGVFPIDLSMIHVDFLVASLYKWCFCPQGTAISVFSDAFMNELTPISSGVFSQVDRGIRATPNAPASSARKFEYGNLNILGIMLAHETFRWFNTLGAVPIHDQYTHLSQGIFRLLKDKGMAFPVDYSDHHQSSIVSFIHPSPEDFMSRLTAAGGNATHRQGLIRLSPGLYQSQNTLDQLALII